MIRNTGKEEKEQSSRLGMEASFCPSRMEGRKEPAAPCDFPWTHEREQKQDFTHHGLPLCRRGTVRNPASKVHRVSDLLLELQGSFMGVLSSSESWPTLQGNEENNGCSFAPFVL